MKLIRVKKADRKSFSKEMVEYDKFVNSNSSKKSFFNDRIAAEIRQDWDKDKEPVEFFNANSGNLYSFSDMERFVSEVQKAIKAAKELKKKAEKLYDAIPNE